LKLTTDGHKASRGLSATAELFVLIYVFCIVVVVFIGGVNRSGRLSFVTRLQCRR